MNGVKFLKKRTLRSLAEIHISGSKSESNRLLIFNALFNNPVQIGNLSNSEDTRLIQKALKTNSNLIDVGQAGTAFRFLTAYFAIKEGRTVVLTGSERMKQRPVGVLVDALINLGAHIEYSGKEGFPPLKITGSNLINNEVELSAGISSQFISALMLIAPKLKNGLKIHLKNEITSQPYIEMTARVLKVLGVIVSIKNRLIEIENLHFVQKQEWKIESDYSSASYFYSLLAISPTTSVLKLSDFRKNSLQGDSRVAEYFQKYFGIKTEFRETQIILSKNPTFRPQPFEVDLNPTPDLAQTIAVCSAALKIKCKLTGLKTLKIKETDRLIALHNELKKIGVNSVIEEDSIEITDFFDVCETPFINTYNDHRMAMSFAPLTLLMDLEIENPNVVEKSYPDFWMNLESVFS